MSKGFNTAGLALVVALLAATGLILALIGPNVLGEWRPQALAPAATTTNASPAPSGRTGSSARTPAGASAKATRSAIPTAIASTARPTPAPTRTTTPNATPSATPSPTPRPTPTPSPTPSPTPAPTPTPSGSSLFDDEFNGSSLGPAWIALNRPGDASNSELECYRPSNASVGGGVLTIIAKVDSSCAGYQYTSAMVQWRSFNFLYGKVEVRANFAGGTTWPAIWMLGANCQQTNISSADNVPPCSWPNPGSDEIDIAEIDGNQTVVNEQIHSSAGNPQCLVGASNVSTNWHTYDLIWRAGSVTWQIDGVTTCTTTQAVPSHPMFLLLNTALGGIGGPVNNGTLPQVSQFDYVRITS